jgi:hypothetical protein
MGCGAESRPMESSLGLMFTVGRHSHVIGKSQDFLTPRFDPDPQDSVRPNSLPLMVSHQRVWPFSGPVYPNLINSFSMSGSRSRMHSVRDFRFWGLNWEIGAYYLPIAGWLIIWARGVFAEDGAELIIKPLKPVESYA